MCGGNHFFFSFKGVVGNGDPGEGPWGLCGHGHDQVLVVGREGLKGGGREGGRRGFAEAAGDDGAEGVMEDDPHDEAHGEDRMEGRVVEASVVEDPGEVPLEVKQVTVFAAFETIERCSQIHRVTNDAEVVRCIIELLRDRICEGVGLGMVEEGLKETEAEVPGR